MTIGNLNAVGVHAGSNYFAPIDEVRQVNTVSIAQRETQNYLQADYAETFQPVERYEPAGEKPDFAAINLMKNSFAEPLPVAVQNMQTFTIEEFQTGAPATGEPQMTLAEFQARQEQRVQLETQAQSQQVHEAVEEMAQPSSSPFEFSAQNSLNPQGLSDTQSALGTHTVTQTQEARVEERVAESATVQTSYERVEEASNSRLTPAQEHGVEEYTRVQDYSDPTSLSMANSQIAA
ncbi:MAG: hypothetical protein LBC86_09170 [Oscillospiraceae bacterium]|nr:hypothetical protein [Oscillospiraceae bacterium]